MPDASWSVIKDSDTKIDMHRMQNLSLITISIRHISYDQSKNNCDHGWVFAKFDEVVIPTQKKSKRIITFAIQIFKIQINRQLLKNKHLIYDVMRRMRSIEHRKH